MNQDPEQHDHMTMLDAQMYHEGTMGEQEAAYWTHVIASGCKSCNAVIAICSVARGEHLKRSLEMDPQ